MKEFLEELDSPGGHMLVCVLLILLGATFHLIGVPKSEDLIMGGSGALLMAMRNAAAKAKV